MTRIPAIGPAQADVATQERLRAIERAMGTTPNLFKTAGYQIYDRTEDGFLVRIRTQRGWAMAVVRCKQDAG